WSPAGSTRQTFFVRSNLKQRQGRLREPNEATSQQHEPPAGNARRAASSGELRLQPRPTFFHPSNYSGKDREENNEDDDFLDVLVDAGYQPPEKVAHKQHAPDPRRTAEHAVRQKCSVRHPGHTR